MSVFFSPNCIVLWNKRKLIMNALFINTKECFFFFFFSNQNPGSVSDWLLYIDTVCISSGYWEWNSFPPAAVCGGEDADNNGTETMCSL